MAHNTIKIVSAPTRAERATELHQLGLEGEALEKVLALEAHKRHQGRVAAALATVGGDAALLWGLVQLDQAGIGGTAGLGGVCPPPTEFRLWPIWARAASRPVTGRPGMRPSPASHVSTAGAWRQPPARRTGSSSYWERRSRLASTVRWRPGRGWPATLPKPWVTRRRRSTTASGLDS